MATPTETVEAEATEEPAKAAPTGTLASILTPVQPARPVERIGSTAAMAEESIATDNSSTTGKADRGSKPEHPVGALVRAIASRIGRTGTQNTVKRQHTITENRMTGNQVNTQHRINRDLKNHDIAQRSGQDHQVRNSKVADNQSKIQQHSGRDHRDSKDSNAKASTQNGKTGRDVKDHRDAKTSDSNSSKQDVMHQTGRDGLPGRPGKTSDAKPTKTDTTAPKDAKPTDTTAEKNGATKTGPGSQRPDQKPPTKDKTTTDETPVPRPRTQTSREAGYHDGTRAAKVAGHVKAYRDGAKDGYADGTADYEKEKRRMDQAKARNAVKPTGPAKPAMAPASGSTADLAKKAAPTPVDAKPAQPVQLTGISDSTVSFDADGTSHTMRRAEVRTLKGFEQRIADKIPALQQVAETSKTTRAKAADHATRARRLAEAARSVEGGDRLVAKLERLAEQAQALHAKTEEIGKAAQRGTEALRALATNAQTRHGGIYRAVVDSPLTKPAEREFYQDKEGN